MSLPFEECKEKQRTGGTLFLLLFGSRDDVVEDEFASGMVAGAFAKRERDGMAAVGKPGKDSAEHALEGVHVVVRADGIERFAVKRNVEHAGRAV